MSLQSLYKPVCSTKPNTKSKNQILEEYLKENAINGNHSNIERLKERLRTKPLLLEKALITNVKRKEKNLRNTTKLGRSAINRLNLYKISKSDQKYKKFLPLHELWKNYIQKLYQGKDNNILIQADERILKVDLHGAEILVQNSKCESFIGMKGIVMKETKNILEIISKDDSVKDIPKRETIFEIFIHGFKLTLFGNAIIGRPGERIVKKFKTNYKSEMMLKNF